MGGELQDTSGRGRSGQPETNQIEELGIQLFGHRVHAVDRLLEHAAEQFGQSGAGVILGILQPPLGGVGRGERTELLSELVQRPRIQYRGFHRVFTPSEPSVM